MTSPTQQIYEPGSPDWWLSRLVQKLLDRQARYDRLEAYVSGNHPLPNGDKRYVKALRDLQKKARTNYIGLICTAPVERMRIKGFRFGPDGEADEDAKNIWAANDMGLQAGTVHFMASAFGDGYVLVSPPGKDDKFPVITAEDVRTCITESDPARLNKIAAGLKMWQDDVTRAVYAVLYLPNSIHKFEAGPIRDDTIDVASITHQLLSSPANGGFQYISTEKNPLGQVPLVRFNWQPAFGEMGRSEAEDVFDIQDRINYTVLQRLIIVNNQAYNQRWISGMTIPKKSKGQTKAPFDPGADALWVTANPEAKFGQFEQADIRQVLEAVRDDVGDMAAATKTPAGYLMNRMVNVSGSALTQDQTGLVSKTRIRMEAMSWGWERVLKHCFAYMKLGKADEVIADTLWADPEIHSIAELADAAGKWVAAGVPLQLVMERANFTPDEIKFAISERDRVEAEQMAREDDMLMKQATLAKKAQPTNPPGGGS